MAIYPGLETAQRFFAGTGHSYDAIVRLGTLWLDLWWKQQILDSIPVNATHIVDQACGTGILTFKIARRFPACRVTGVELRDEYLNIAKQKARAMGVQNVEFVLGRAEEIRVSGPIDCITSSYLAKYAELPRLIQTAQTMLRPGGRLVMHDFTYPSAAGCAKLWELYFAVLRGAGSRLFPEWQTVFDELPGLLRQTAWTAELLRQLQAHGFTALRLESLSLGAAAVVTASSPGSRPRTG